MALTKIPSGGSTSSTVAPRVPTTDSSRAVRARQTRSDSAASVERITIRRRIHVPSRQLDLVAG